MGYNEGMKMGKEIRKREESSVLYEPPEPLFPDGFQRRRIRIWRFVALAFFVSLAVFIWTFAASGEGEGGGGSESERVSDTNEESEGESFTVTPDASESVGGEIPSETEGKTEEGESTDGESWTREEEFPESEEMTLAPEQSGSAEVDLSQIEKGESYVVNYSDKAVDIEGLLDRGFAGGEAVGSAAPLVLIIHTHTSEEYLGAESGYRGLKTVVSAGEAMSEAANRLGVPSVHCTVIHDGDGKNSYLNARKTVEVMLEIYPSIKYVIDLHRISLYDGGLPIKTVSGGRDGSAQIRLTVGAKEEYGNWQEDLSLCLALRKSLNQNGNRVCMPVVISPNLPNGDVSRYYFMADIGACGNTVEEAMAAGKRLGVALADVLIG